MSVSSTAELRYAEELRELDRQEQTLGRRESRYSMIRVVTFFAALTLLGLGYLADGGGLAVILGWSAFTCFLVAVIANEPVREQLDSCRQKRSVVRRLVARTRRDWDTLSNPAVEKKVDAVPLSANQRAVATDLDLTGKTSLFHLVSMAATSPGIRTLVHWLTGPAVEADSGARRRAAEAMAPLYSERLQFYALSKEIGRGQSAPENFVAWAAGPMWLDKRPWLVAWANLSAATSAVLLTAVAGGLLQLFPVDAVRLGFVGLLGVAIANFLLGAALLAPAHRIFSVAMANRRSVADYRELFSAAEWLPESQAPDDLLRRIRGELLDGEMPAVKGMGELQAVARAGALKQSAATFLLYVPLQAFTLWDVRVLRKLERWQAKYGQATVGWFDALGEVEALASVAAVIDEQSDWVPPSWVSPGSELLFESTQLGHPLIPDDQRVCNDVSVGPTGTLLLVTGSNMSGKSTMLRSVGLNVALAAIGAPVCADSLRLPSVEMGTSIRVSDDLSQGVSFYMAELQRLKAVADQARKIQSDSSRTFLFLLDEILQGTNSRERQIAVVRVLRHLSGAGAIGAISTHDLELADEPELKAISTTVHFRETIGPDAEGRDQMTFDYRMRQGVSPTTNALRLLDIVGLGADDSATESTPPPAD